MSAEEEEDEGDWRGDADEDGDGSWGEQITTPRRSRYGKLHAAITEKLFNLSVRLAFQGIGLGKNLRWFPAS